jgi:VWFA-related protein
MAKKMRLLAAVLLLAGVASGVRGDAPLTTVDVVRLLSAGVSEHTILYELRDRGFSERLDPAREADLRKAGATETLVVAVRRASPEKPPPAAPAPAPSPEAKPLQANEPVFTAKTRTVRVPVSVVDKLGEPVLGLQGADFQISEDGKRQKVTLFSGERRPLKIAVALDVSRSMDDKMRQVGEALKRFVELLEPADEIMVITFSEQVRVVQEFTSDRELLGNVLDRLEPLGGTALYDAAFLAIQRVAKSPAESKAVVLVTDGVDTSSKITLDELREYARRQEVPVFSIGLDGGRGLTNSSRPPGMHGPGGGGRGGPGGGGRGGWPGGGGGRGGGPGGGRPGGRGGMGRGFDEKPLTELAEDTGGRAEILKGIQHYTPGSDEAPGSDRLKGAVESIAMTLRHRYLIGYEPPDGKASWRTIRVEVSRPDTTARTRKGYYAGG